MYFTENFEKIICLRLPFRFRGWVLNSFRVAVHLYLDRETEGAKCRAGYPVEASWMLRVL